MKTRIKKSQVIALILALFVVCGQFASASTVTINPMEDDLGIGAYSEPPSGDTGSGGSGGTEGSGDTQSGGTISNFGSNIIIDPNNNTIQGENEDGETEISGLTSTLGEGEGLGEEEGLMMAMGAISGTPPGVSVVVNVEQVEGGFGNDDMVTIRGRIQDLGDGAGGPAIQAGWTLQITFPEYLTAEQDIGDWLKDMRDRGFISAASGMSGNVCTIYFTGGGSTAMLVSEFEWVMRVNLENYVGYTQDIIFTFNAGGSTYVTSWEGPGIGGGLSTPGASKNIWSNVSNVNGINIIMDRTKPIGYEINVYSPALTEGTHYFTIEDVLNQRVVMCTPSGTEVTLANAVSSGAMIIDEKLSAGNYTISPTSSGQGFKITVTGPGVAEGNYRFLYYVKLIDPTYQGVLTNGIRVDLYTQTTQFIKEDIVEMVTTKNSLLDIGKKVYDRNGTVSDRGLVMLNETTKEVTFQIVMRQIKDSVTQETGGSVMAEDILHAAFGTPIIGPRYSNNGTNPFKLEISGNRIHIVKDGTGFIKDGIYTLEFTVPINQSVFLPGQRVSNMVRSTEVFVYRSAQLKVNKVWLNPDGKIKGDVKFRLMRGSTDVLGAPVVLSEGQDFVTIYLDYLNDKILEGTYDYTLVEEVAENSDYASAASQTIRITKTTQATTGEVKFVTTGTGVHQVTFTNTPDDKEGSIRFDKYGKIGSASAVKIGGGTFKLYKKSASGQFDILVNVEGAGTPGVYNYTTLTGSHFETFTAHENGVLINKLPYGEYKIFEQEAPVGYVMVSQWSEAKVVSKIYKDPYIRMDNNYFSAGKISIIKSDNTPAKNKLQGVQFKLEKEDGGIAAQTKSTNSSGRVDFTDLPSGVYWLTELPYEGYTGYMSPNKVKVTVTVDGDTVVGDVGLTGLVQPSITGKIITLNWVNEQLFGKIIVTKVALIGSAPLAGAIFELYKANSSGVIVGGVLQTSSPTGADGKIEFTGLAYGKYVVKEKQAPQGYTLDVDRQEVVTLNSASASLTWANETKKGTITLKKVGAGQYGNAPVALSGVIFTLENEAHEIKTYTTNSQGRLTITGLEAGTYKLKEQSLPSGSGYVLSTREETIVIGGAGDVWSYDFTSESKWFVNERILKQIKVLKTDENGVKMNNVTFKLNGTDLAGRTIPEQTAVTVDGVATFTNVPYGNYTLTEVSPAGYGAITRNVVINASTTTEIVEISVQNLPYELIVKKVAVGPPGGGTIKLAGAVFNLEIGGKYVQATPLGNGVYKYTGVTSTKADATGLTTVAPDGQFRITHIPAGTYVIREIQAPTGYVLLTDTQSVTISGAVTEPYVRTVSNADIKGHLLIRKYKQYSENRSLLPGVTFIIEGPDERCPITATTDANGEIRIQNLLFGEYAIREDPTTTPVGYYAEAIDNIFIAQNGVTKEVEVVNYPVLGEVEITKVDRKDGTTTLMGAVFSMRPVKADGTIDSSATPLYAISNALGKAVFRNVPYGIYAIQEDLPPVGYLPDTTIRYVVIGTGVTIPPSLVGKIELSNQFVWDNTKISGSLHIFKFDAKTREKLPGATFCLFQNSDGKGIILTGSGGLYDYSREALAGEEPTVIQTNAEGEAVILGLPYGMYTIQEVGVPEGYRLASSTFGAAIYGDRTDVEVYNTPKAGKLRVLKVDAATDQPLLGAEIQVFKRDGSGNPEGGMLFKTVTDISGVGVINDIPLGQYVAVETVPPFGYELSSGAVKPFDITAANVDTQVELKYENEKSAYGLKIKKVDADDTGTTLAGAIFRVTNSAGFSLEVTTNASGIATLDGLSKGTYKVKEIQAPAGYDLDPTEYTVDVNLHGGYVEVIAKNKLIIGKVRLIKQDEDGKLLTGAVFELYDASDNKLWMNEVSANNYVVSSSGAIDRITVGTAVIGNLPEGVYTFKEVTPPGGYTALDTERTFKIDADNYDLAEPLTVTATNVKNQSAVALRKVDVNDPRIHLAGAEFELARKEGAAYQRVEVKVTDAAGYVVFKNLTMGEYRITEITAPDGYQLWTDTILFEVDASGKIAMSGTLYELTDGIFTVTVTNTPKTGDVVVTKVDKKDHEITLSGAVFAMYLLKGNGSVDTSAVVRRAISDSTGKAIFKDVPYGVYKIVEEQAPSGYVLDSAVVRYVAIGEGVTVPPGITVEPSNTFDWENTQTEGGLRIIKFDEQDKSVQLAGAEFKLYFGTKGVLLTGSAGMYTFAGYAATPEDATVIQTNSSGVARITGLVYGVYTVKEVKAPDGYRLNENTFEVSVFDKNTMAEVNVYNARKLGRLKVIKVDAADESLLLKGAEIHVFKQGADGEPEGDALFKTVTNLKGEGMIENIPVGKYVAVEVDAPEGYELTLAGVEQKKPFEITLDDVKNETIIELVFKNDKSVYGLKIKKVDVDDTSKVLEGAVFSVVNDATSFYKEVTTGSDGIATLDNIPKGTYKVKEIKAPKGYDIDPTEHSVLVDTHGAYAEVTVADKFIIGKVRLLKQDEDGKTLDGARFELYDASGKKLWLKEISANVYEVATDGTIENFTAGNVVIGNLTEGDYTFKEISPPAGYTKLEDDRTFTINAANYNTTEIFTVTITNVKHQAAVALIKVDEDDKRIHLAGAEFQLSRLQSGAYVEVEKKTTDASGAVIFNNLTMGTYRITETKAPDGYQLWKNSINFEVNEEGKIKIGSSLYELEGGVFKATVTNAKIIKDFAVKKVCSVTGNPLAGAVFRLTGSGISDMTLTTTSTGISNTVTLPIGTYYLRETAAPTGYDLLTDLHTVVVTKDGISVDGTALTGTPYTITIKNTPSTVRALLYKTDSASDDPLAGAAFTVTERGTTNVQTLQTGKNGQSNVIQLKAGSTYDIVETIAPSGYNRPLQGWTVTVAANGQVTATGSAISAWNNGDTVVINIKNTKPGDEPPTDPPIPLGPGLPKTGESGGNMLLMGLVGILLSGITLFLFTLLGKKEEKTEILPALV